MIPSVTTATFDSEVLKSKRPVVVDFWAPWCGPCRALGPLLELAHSAVPEVHVVKINVDEEPEIAARFGVRSIPTIVRFSEGEEVSRRVGVAPRPELELFFRGAL